MSASVDTTSHWHQTTPLPRFHKLGCGIQVDVVVVGGGITGVTAAYLLKKSGRTVALIDRGRCGGFDTGNTTAHITYVTDTRLHELVEKLGRDKARLTWEAGLAAMDQIDAIIRTENMDCEFRWIPGYLHAPCIPGKNGDPGPFLKDADFAREFGFDADFQDKVPFMERGGIKFRYQAKFHPLKYLGALLRTIPGDGSHVFENSEAGEIKAEPLTVQVGDHRIQGGYLVLATHTPLVGHAGLVASTLFQSKLFLYTTYAIGAAIPAGVIPEASFWDTDDPYTYLRVDSRRGHDYAILGGEDHKTGQLEDTNAAYQRLEKSMHRLVRGAKVDARWSGQVIETADGLPYIGETADRQFVATGFGGNGITFGTLGGMMAVDAVHGRINPWSKLFSARRKEGLLEVWDYLRENKDYPYYLVRDHLARAEDDSLDKVERNQGMIIRQGGRKVAAYRDAHGKLTLCSPVCTHLKCIVAWNGVEQTWDCPCHGSRFGPTGEVLSGPAEEPLEPIDRESLKPEK